MRWPLTAKMAPLVMDDLNTDVIYPARFLLVLDREDLGEHIRKFALAELGRRCGLRVPGHKRKIASPSDVPGKRATS